MPHDPDQVARRPSHASGEQARWSRPKALLHAVGKREHASGKAEMVVSSLQAESATEAPVRNRVPRRPRDRMRRMGNAGEDLGVLTHEPRFHSSSDQRVSSYCARAKLIPLNCICRLSLSLERWTDGEAWDVRPTPSTLPRPHTHYPPSCML